MGFCCFDPTISVAASTGVIFVAQATAAVIMNVLMESNTVLSRIEDTSSFVANRDHEEENIFGCNTNACSVGSKQAKNRNRNIRKDQEDFLCLCKVCIRFRESLLFDCKKTICKLSGGQTILLFGFLDVKKKEKDTGRKKKGQHTAASQEEEEQKKKKKKKKGCCFIFCALFFVVAAVVCGVPSDIFMNSAMTFNAHQ